MQWMRLQGCAARLAAPGDKAAAAVDASRGELSCEARPE